MGGLPCSAPLPPGLHARVHAVLHSSRMASSEEQFVRKLSSSIKAVLSSREEVAHALRAAVQAVPKRKLQRLLLQHFEQHVDALWQLQQERHAAQPATAAVQLVISERGPLLTRSEVRAALAAATGNAATPDARTAVVAALGAAHLCTAGVCAARGEPVLPRVWRRAAGKKVPAATQALPALSAVVAALRADAAAWHSEAVVADYVHLFNGTIAVLVNAGPIPGDALLRVVSLGQAVGAAAAARVAAAQASLLCSAPAAAELYRPASASRAGLIGGPAAALTACGALLLSALAQGIAGGGLSAAVHAHARAREAAGAATQQHDSASDDEEESRRTVGAGDAHSRAARWEAQLLTSIMGLCGGAGTPSTTWALLAGVLPRYLQSAAASAAAVRVLGAVINRALLHFPPDEAARNSAAFLRCALMTACAVGAALLCHGWSWRHAHALCVCAALCWLAGWRRRSRER